MVTDSGTLLLSGMGERNARAEFQADCCATHFMFETILNIAMKIIWMSFGTGTMITRRLPIFCPCTLCLEWAACLLYQKPSYEFHAAQLMDWIEQDFGQEKAELLSVTRAGKHSIDRE